MFQTWRSSFDIVDLVFGVLLIGLGVLSIQQGSYQLTTFDYLAILLGLVIMFFYLTVVEEQTNSLLLKRILRAILIIGFGLIVAYAPIVGSSLIIGFGLGFLSNAFRAYLV